MGRTKLWEDTVVLAMRDWQWENALRGVQEGIDPERTPDATVCRSPRPPGMLKHDGRAESKLGDISLKSRERLFLFEVKSTLDQVSTEWRPKKGAKWAFQRLQDLASTVVKSPDNQWAIDMFSLSLRGHYVCYWSDNEEVKEISGGGTAVSGRLDVQPYIAACAAVQTLPERLTDKRMDWPCRYSREVFGRDLESADSRVVGLGDLLRGKVDLNIPNLKKDERPRGGLNKEEFEKYVAFLCGEDSGSHGLATDGDLKSRFAENVHLVAMSSRGSFFRVVSDTAHLQMLLDGAFRPAPKPSKKRSAHSSGISGNTPIG